MESISSSAARQNFSALLPDIGMSFGPPRASACLIAISRMLAALTRIVLSISAISARAAASGAIGVL